MLTLHTNVAQSSSLNSQRTTGGKLNAIMRDLSAGKKNDLYKTDPAAARISAMLGMHASGTRAAMGNMTYARSSTRVAQSALDKAGDLLRTMKGLATQSADGLKGQNERAALQQQYTHNAQALRAIFDNTKFAGTELLKMEIAGANAATDGLLAKGPVELQVGAGAAQTKSLNLSAELRKVFETMKAATSHFATATTGASYKVLDGYIAMTTTVVTADDAATAILATLASPGTSIRTIMATQHGPTTGRADTWEATLKSPLEALIDDGYASVQDLSSAIERLVLTHDNNTNPSGIKLASDQIRDLTDALKNELTPYFQAVAHTGAGSEISTASEATQNMGRLEAAIKELAIVQASIGATMIDLDGREEVQSALLQHTREAHARMNEVDFAESVSELTKLQAKMNVNLQMLQKAGEMPGMIQTLLG